MRIIHPDLLADMAGSSTTLTELLLVGPLPDATYRGFTLLDIDVTYDSGFGSRTYKARTGFEQSALEASNDLGVDNSEATTLPPVVGFEVEGFTQAQIDAGALDKTPFVIYLVNYKNLTTGRHGIVHGGTVGEIRRKVGDLTVLELRSLSQQTKQVIGEVYSIPCRAQFGSQSIGTGGGVVEERFPCGYDLTAEWVSGTVEGVGAETDRIFADSGLTQADDYFAPGVVEWLTGNNAGQKQEADAFASGTVELQFPTVNPIQLGDTYRIRRDCTKTDAGHNSCRTFWGTAWTLHYRGERWMPIADASQLMTPGAAIGASSTAVGTGEGTGTTVEIPSGGGGTGGSTSAPTLTIGATSVSVMDYGAVGNGVADDTAAFNAAFAALPGDGGTVTAPDGTYLIDSTVSVKPLSHTRLSLATNAILQAKDNTVDRDYIVLIQAKTHVEITGGTIHGDRDTFVPQSGTTSEHGHGIACYGSTNVNVLNVTTTKCVGDGMSIGPRLTGITPDSIWIENLVSTYNRRQGLSITKSSNVTGKGGEIAYIGGTGGTPPMSGIDIEPDSPDLGETASNVTIDGIHIHHCTGNGIEVHEGSTTLSVTGCTLEYNAYGLYAVTGASATLTGNTIQHNQNEGVRLGGTTTGYTLGGASGSANRNTFFNNKTNVHGVVTTGSTTEHTGTSSATAAHINIGSSATATVSYNLYGP